MTYISCTITNQDNLQDNWLLIFLLFRFFALGILYQSHGKQTDALKVSFPQTPCFYTNCPEKYLSSLFSSFRLG